VESAPHTALSQPQHIMSLDLYQDLEKETQTLVEVTSPGTASSVSFWFEFEMCSELKVESNKAESYLRQAATLLRPTVSVEKTAQLLTKIQGGVLNMSLKN